MDDDEDLDDLLDEVEKKFCRNVSVASSARARDTSEAGGARRLSAIKPVAQRSSITEDIDALLQELVEDEHGDFHQSKREKLPKEARVEPKPPSQSGGRKCCPVFVGGSSVTNGVGTATSKRSCDQLRCISCDFRVLMFDDCEWDSSCDYLFLRNNVPDRQKLRAKLKKRRGFRAYACQCSWFSSSSSSSEPTDLGVHPQLRWVCGKHQD
ncbi:cilia- and flagella-associated protein 418 [Hippoglossus stenolepis]|uniref:cilia- and flagella-associated protein 418 n=1 Tax=Hippoglossus stenolepis TaxID=195615 RepID=UPI001FAF0098|nr:cilia- and flagella-associated protein 418 [Hippoglossus stenolepis]